MKGFRLSPAAPKRGATRPIRSRNRGRASLADGLATDAEIKAIEKDVRDAVNAAAVFAKEAERPTPETIQSGVYA